MVYLYQCSPEEWREFIEAMHSGEEFETDEEMWYYWLEVLPPVMMHRTLTFVPFGKTPDFARTVNIDFGFAEGAEPVTVFWRSLDGKRFIGQRTKTLNWRI